MSVPFRSKSVSIKGSINDVFNIFLAYVEQEENLKDFEKYEKIKKSIKDLRKNPVFCEFPSDQNKIKGAMKKFIRLKNQVSFSTGDKVTDLLSSFLGIITNYNKWVSMYGGIDSANRELRNLRKNQAQLRKQLLYFEQQTNEKYKGLVGSLNSIYEHGADFKKIYEGVVKLYNLQHTVKVLGGTPKFDLGNNCGTVVDIAFYLVENWNEIKSAFNSVKNNNGFRGQHLSSVEGCFYRYEELSDLLGPITLLTKEDNYKQLVVQLEDFICKKNDADKISGEIVEYDALLDSKIKEFYHDTFNLIRKIEFYSAEIGQLKDGVIYQTLVEYKVDDNVLIAKISDIDLNYLGEVSWNFLDKKSEYDLFLETEETEKNFILNPSLSVKKIDEKNARSFEGKIIIENVKDSGYYSINLRLPKL